MFETINEIKKASNGDAWHGNHVMQILNNVKPENAFNFFIADAHSIAKIALHLTAWTEEVTSRLMENVADEPAMGDWPAPDAQTPQAWEKIIFNFKVANEELIRYCESIDQNQWDVEITETQNSTPGKSITRQELLSGLVQHHAYHSGQIALLSKFE